MCQIDDSSRVGCHKEASKQRTDRDESDIQKLINTIKTTMSNPFELNECSPEDPVPLRNIATGTVMPEESADRLLGSFAAGSLALKNFRKDILQKADVSFWDRIKKLNIPTFASISKTAAVKSKDDKIMAIAADRSLFGRQTLLCDFKPFQLCMYQSGCCLR